MKRIKIFVGARHEKETGIGSAAVFFYSKPGIFLQRSYITTEFHVERVSTEISFQDVLEGVLCF
jgi:hypothetical protein